MAAPVSTAFRTPVPTAFIPGASSRSPATTEAKTTFDFLEIGTKHSDGPSILGDIVWLRADSVPRPWIEDGFPGPTPRYEYDLAYIYDGLGPGLEVFPTGDGYLALGSGEGNWGRVSYEASGRAVDLTSDYWIPLAESWTLTPSFEWVQTAPPGSFGDSAFISAQPMSVAGQGERIVIIGATSPAFDPLAEIDALGWPAIAELASEPAAWTTTDLASWTQIDADFATPEAHTKLTSVSASPDGWVIAGIRWKRNGPDGSEWVAWLSPDGVEWEEVDLRSAIEAPWCATEDNRPCSRLYATAIDGAIVMYTWQWRFRGRDRSSWEMWIGVLPG